MRSLLLRRLAPLLALIAISATACGSAERTAITIDGTKVSAESLQDELEAIRANTAYRKAIEQSDPNDPDAVATVVGGAGKGTFTAAFTAEILKVKAYYALLEDWLRERDEQVTDAEVRDARDALGEQIDTALEAPVFGRFPAAYRNVLGRQEAIVAKVSELLAAEADEIEEACVSHILVSSETRSLEEAATLAASLKAQLDGGADFAELARASSDDPGSGEAGGELGCAAPGAYVPEFEAAAFSQPVGEVGDPVQTEFGYHLILVTSREKVADPNAGQQALNALLPRLTCDAEVTVDPRYGRWDRSACDEDGVATVTPPKGPKQGS